MEYLPLHSFQINEERQFAVLTFDTERTLEQDGNRQSFDILVKDLSIDKLMPVLILNSPDGEVAFDLFNGFYYTQTSGPDGGSRGARVFRHQLGTLHSEDVLIYEEKNPDFNVSGNYKKPNTTFS
jgi:protease II